MIASRLSFAQRLIDAFGSRALETKLARSEIGWITQISARSLDAVVNMLKEEQQRTGIELLWVTACLFINPRFAHGAATSPKADVLVYAAAQVKKAIDVAHELGAEPRFLWRPRRVFQPLEHRYEAGGGTPGEIPAHGCRL